MSAVDPMQDMIDNTVTRISSAVASASSDCVKVMVRADGKIEGIYVTDAASHMSIPQLATTIAHLAENARLDALGSVREAIEQLSNDPRITAVCEGIERSMDLPMSTSGPVNTSVSVSVPRHDKDFVREPGVEYVEPDDGEDFQQPTSWLVR